MRAAGLVVLALGAALLVDSACSRKGSGTRPRVEGAIALDAVLGAWSRAGLQPDGFGTVDAAAWKAVACAEGMVAGLKALLCDYGAEDALEPGQRLMQEQSARDNVHTGVVVRNGRTLLSLTDRSQADPSGRTASRLVKSFLELK